MGIFDKPIFGSSAPKSGMDQGSIPTVNNQTMEEQKIVSWVRTKVEESRSNASRITHEGIWLTNTAYLLGFDGVYYDAYTRTLRPVATSPRMRKNRVNVNKILPTINNRQARLCKNPPKWEVRPNSADTEDKEAARLSYQVSQTIYEQQKINEKRLDLYMWLQQCGHSYTKTSWDPSLGKLMMDPATGQYTFEGDVRVDVISAFEVFADPLATNLDDATWVIHAKVRKLEYFKDRYPEKGQMVREEGVWLLSLQNEQRIQSLTTNGRGDTANNPITQKNSAIEIVYYEKRSKQYPFGRQIATANGVLLEDKELPIGEIPFSKFDDIKIGGKFYSESIITHLRPIQDQYSKTVSLRANWTNRMLMGKYLAAKGHGLIADSPNDQSGEIVEYDPVPNAPVPQELHVPAIPAYAYKETDELQKDIFDISGINEVSRAILPAAGIPAKGMEFLQEQDDTRIGVITEQHEHAWAKTIKHMLLFAQSNYKTPRLLKLVGKDMEYTFKSFVGADMRNSADVIVKRGSTIPTSKFLNQQQILNTYDKGLLGDPADPAVREKVFSLLEFGQGQEIWKKVSLVEAQVQRDLDMIKQGQVPIVSEFDNHPRHVDLKNEYRLSLDFEQLPGPYQKILMDNMNMHLEYMVNQTNPGLDAAAKLNQTKTDLGQQELGDLSQLGHVPPEWSEQVPNPAGGNQQ